jgi:hypothetical protein
MKIQFRRLQPVFLVICLAAWAAAVSLARAAEDAKADKDDKKETKGEAAKESATPKRVSQDADGNAVVTLDAAMQERIGLKVAALKAFDYTPDVVAYGTILNPAPLALLDSELRSADVAAQASTAQAERARKLFADDANVSRKSLETAEAQARADEIHLETTKQRLEFEWGPIIAQLSAPERRSVINRLKNHEFLLARADLPLTDSPKEKVASAWFSALGSPATFKAAATAPAPALDPATQARGYFLEVTNAEPMSAPVPGAAITAHLVLDAKTTAGVVIPRNAILRSNGAAWVYAQTSAESFTRRAVKLDTPVEDGWFMSGDFKADDKIVVRGGALILSEELQNLGGGD